MQNDRASRGASNKAIRWRPTYDSARRLVCSAFGLDFGSIILTKKDPDQEVRSSQRRREATTVPPSHLYRQRLSVYMQRQSNEPQPLENMTKFSTAPYKLREHARGNLMIISEYSSGEVGEIVSTQDLLTLNPGSSVAPGTTNEQAPISAAQSIIIHIFGRVCQIWRRQIALIHDEHADLEDHIYEQPADGSRAGNVWAMSQHLHGMLKLMNRHAKIIEAIQEDFHLFVGNERTQDWLDETIEEFAQLSNDLSTDYLEPLEHMIDLVRCSRFFPRPLLNETQMYKSVTIRDSKQSLELASSLWRLSWITFIFLPLTFLTGLFGMNVASLEHYPSIKWYFVTAVPLVSYIHNSHLNRTLNNRKPDVVDIPLVVRFQAIAALCTDVEIDWIF
jgi:CorA-like Mg2+ transporter protein